MSDHNAMRWDGSPGHYEVWYVSLTDRGSGAGAWVRLTMRAPVAGEPECSLWFMAMTQEGERVARKRTFPISALSTDAAPFRLQVENAELSDRGSAGAIDDVRWELRWEPGTVAGEIVHPLLEKAKIARTMMVVPHPDLAIEGTIVWGDRRIELSGARGGQTHLWGLKHASRWCWLHASDLEGLDGAPRRGDWIEAVSVVTPRAGREVGPSTPVTGVLLGEPFDATGPVRVLRAKAEIGLTDYSFETRGRSRRLRVEVSAPPQTLVGVTYDDPDGEQAWCFNSEVASLRAWVWDRSRGGGARWLLRDTLQAPGRAHFEYAQRSPVGDVPVLV
jgi:hypothetical protein